MFSHARWLAPLALATLLDTGCAHDVAQGVASASRVSTFHLVPGQRVAVLTFAGPKGGVLSELVTIELLRQQVDVVDRDSLDRLVAEMKRTQAGLFDDALSQEEIIRQLGKIVNADVIIYGESHAIEPNTIQLRDETEMGGRRGGAMVFFLSWLPSGWGAYLLATSSYVPGAVLAGIGGVAFIVGASVMGAYDPYDDFGDKSPAFYLADSSLALRAFSTQTGEVVWWGCMETFVQAEKGDEVTVMDHLRVTARLAAKALLDPQFTEFAKRAEDRDISEELWPSLEL